MKLAGRITLDDPEDFGARTPAARRSHGTSMSSLIVHGDLQAGDPALVRPLYVRPVMIYDAAEQAEITPLTGCLWMSSTWLCAGSLPVRAVEPLRRPAS